MAFSTLGAASLPARLTDAAVEIQTSAISENPARPGLVSYSPGECLTQIVRVTLDSQQISFCSPTSLPFNVVEDSTSDPFVNYAGLAQIKGYGTVSIKAIAPGYTPGVGRPVYNTGDVAKYRQDVWNIETAKTDRRVSDGPSGVFWNENVPSIQLDLTLSTSLGNLKLRSIEWYIEHNNRLWSFMITWDTGMQNADEWVAVSVNFSAQTQVDNKSADTAIDLGTAYQESKSAQGALPSNSPVDVGAPSWWSGICDVNNYYAHTHKHSNPLGATWHGVTACGPIGGPDYGVYFPGASWGVFEFECVELVMRFLYLEWGIAPWGGDANTIKNNPPSTIVFEPNGTHALVPGDIITEDGSASNSVGHTVVVTGVDLDGNGTGTVSIMEQNASTYGHRTLNVTNWQIQPDAYCFSQTIQGWLHVKANQPAGDPDPLFAPAGTGLNGPVSAIGLQSDGGIIISGDFTGYNGISRNHVARLNTDGTLDTNFNPGYGVSVTSGTAQVFALKVQSDDKILIGGYFDKYGTTTRYNIARLTNIGTLDTTFTPPVGMTATAGSPSVNAIAIQPTDGKILMSGNFNSLSGVTHNFIARLNSDGTLDTSFNATVDNIVYAQVVQSNGKILIGGSFSTVDGTALSGIARLNSDGTLDTTFNPGTGTVGAVSSIALQENKILIAGNFSTYNGTSRNMIARLNSDGSLDITFYPGTGVSGTGAYLQAVVSQPDGRILIGGKFSSYNGTTLYNFIRLNNDGTRDTTFYTRMDNLVQAVLLQPDNKILIGGDFTGYIARLLNYIEPCYTLTTLVNPAAGGTIKVDPTPNCPGSKYINGTVAQVTAVLITDYWLVNWSGDASGSANPGSVTLDGDKSVTANVMASPGHFNKIAPTDGTADQPADLTLSWGTSNGATSYEYCLDTTDNNDCDSGNWITTGTNTSVALSNLLTSVTYYWQVRARDLVDTTDGGSWWSFTRNGTPAVPITVSPSGIILDIQPAYVWNESAGATSYHLIVYSLTASTNVIDDSVDNSACSGDVCMYHPSLTLPVGSYEFKVSALTADGTSDFSAWSPFMVRIGFFMPIVVSPN